AFEALRPRTESRQLGGAADRTDLGLGLRIAAVMAAQLPVGVEDEGDVAVVAAERRSTRAAVQRWSDAAAVEEQDRLAAALCDRAEFREQRRRERVAGLAPQVDDAHRGKRTGEAPAELEPLEAPPALGSRRRTAEDCDGAFERGAFRGDGARVVTRIGFLFVRRVVLLVDADHAEPCDRCEDGGARADDDRRLPARDARALVT